MEIPRGTRTFLLPSVWTTRLQNWEWGKDQRLRSWDFSRRWPGLGGTGFSWVPEPGLSSQRCLWKVPLPGSSKILYLKCQTRQSALKGKLPQQSQPSISSALLEHRRNDGNRLATQSLNVGVPGQGKLQQLACCANDLPVWYRSWIAPWLPMIWLSTFWVA